MERKRRVRYFEGQASFFKGPRNCEYCDCPSFEDIVLRIQTVYGTVILCRDCVRHIHGKRCDEYDVLKCEECRTNIPRLLNWTKSENGLWQPSSAFVNEMFEFYDELEKAVCKKKKMWAVENEEDPFDPEVKDE